MDLLEWFTGHVVELLLASIAVMLIVTWQQQERALKRLESHVATEIMQLKAIVPTRKSHPRGYSTGRPLFTSQLCSSTPTVVDEAEGCRVCYHERTASNTGRST
jgi:membrane-anchored protein YejM (alkaline phosphatase superfamily)